MCQKPAWHHRPTNYLRHSKEFHVFHGCILVDIFIRECVARRAFVSPNYWSIKIAYHVLSNVRDFFFSSVRPHAQAHHPMRQKGKVNTHFIIIVVDAVATEKKKLFGPSEWADECTVCACVGVGHQRWSLPIFPTATHFYLAPLD